MIIILTLVIKYTQSAWESFQHLAIWVKIMIMVIIISYNIQKYSEGRLKHSKPDDIRSVRGRHSMKTFHINDLIKQR